MAISQGMSISFKKQVLLGDQDFDANTFKLALFTDTASLSSGTATYSTSAEVSGIGYTAGGNTLSIVDVTVDGSVGIVDVSNTAWTTATFTARGGLIYNSSKSNSTVAVLDFGGNKSVENGTFTIQFPAAAAATAIIRLV
jgi:hypothetical protein